MPDKTVDNLEGLSGGCPSLVQGEPIQPLQGCLDIIFSPKLLDKFFCLDSVKCHDNQKERTKSPLLHLLGRKGER